MGKSEEDIIDVLAAHVAEEAADNYRSALKVFDKCESPIERVMLAAFIANPIEGIETMRGEPWDPDSLLCHCWPGSVEWVGQINQQVVIGNYRTDFFLQAFNVDNWGPSAKITGRWLALAIECDGHDFHERTKEQARSDKRRDRWFQTHGISVLRFTGSEIWADPIGCVDQVHEAFFAAYSRRQRK